MKKISIIVPSYNESSNLLKLHDQLISVINQIDNYEWSIIYINDGSSDDSIAVLEQIAKDEKVKVIDFSRNFGKEVAISAGIDYIDSSVDAAITLDADLQHPPALIREFIDKWEGGADIVIGVRSASHKQTIVRKMGSLLFYKIMKLISNNPMEKGATDFRLVDKKVLAEYKKIKEKNRLYRGLIDWLGFNKSQIYFVAPQRSAGEVGYSLRKLTALAVNSFINYSISPLRLIAYLGLFIFISSVILLVYMALSNYLEIQYYTSMAFFIVSNTLLNGLVLICFGVVSLYIANIHTEVVNRPLYIVKRVINGCK